MANQQTKRRRKRYQAGSAYAGHVKPPGIFSIFSDIRLIRAVFVLMAFGLVAGSFAIIFGSDVLFSGGGGHGGGGGGSSTSFVQPDSSDFATAQPRATVEVTTFAGPPAFTLVSGSSYTATIRTDVGDIRVELFADTAEEAVNNFVFLAEEGFYDSLVFHFVEQGFSANAGDPACTTTSVSACRGDGGPGYELTGGPLGDFEAGVLGMANGSQFFIALTDSEQFDDFTAFGRIVSGLDVAEQVTAGTAIETIEILVQ